MSLNLPDEARINVPLRLVEVVRDKEGFTRAKSGERLVPGDCYFAPEYRWATLQLSSCYPGPMVRKPIFIVLPDGLHWCVDEKAFNPELGYHGDGWEVTGELPNISVTPSIQTDRYHGWVKNGVLTRC